MSKDRKRVGRAIIFAWAFVGLLWAFAARSELPVLVTVVINRKQCIVAHVKFVKGYLQIIVTTYWNLNNMHVRTLLGFTHHWRTLRLEERLLLRPTLHATTFFSVVVAAVALGVHFCQ